MREICAGVLALTLSVTASTAARSDSIRERTTASDAQYEISGHGSAFNGVWSQSEEADPGRMERYELAAPGRDGNAPESYRGQGDDRAGRQGPDNATSNWMQDGGAQSYGLNARNRDRDRGYTDPFGKRQYRFGNRWRERDSHRDHNNPPWDTGSGFRANPSLAAPWTNGSSFSDHGSGDLTIAPLPDPVQVLDTQPADPDSRFGDALARALERYRDIANAGGWGTVPEGGALKPGMSDPRVATMRRRLAITGELSRETLRETHYDAGLETAVKLFQARHGLTVDGVVGHATVAAMNVPVEVRIDQIAVNMDRWRQSAPELGARYVLVNIPAFELEVIEDEATVLRMDVITGEPDHPTPVFSDRIDYVEFNPFWNVPKSITRDELIEQFAEDASRAQGFEVFYRGAFRDAVTFDWASYLGRREVPFTVRQTPGPMNALGQVKFMLPNRYNVYLHDTPAQYLFVRNSRALSHGCVRLSRPREFAYYLLGGKSGWSDNRVDIEIDGDENRQVPLDRSVPVHFIYMTAWVDEQGRAHLRDDIYGRDGGAVTTASND